MSPGEPSRRLQLPKENYYDDSLVTTEAFEEAVIVILTCRQGNVWGGPRGQKQVIVITFLSEVAWEPNKVIVMSHLSLGRPSRMPVASDAQRKSSWRNPQGTQETRQWQCQCQRQCFCHSSHQCQRQCQGHLECRHQCQYDSGATSPR